jgi:hypothetical protein
MAPLGDDDLAIDLEGREAYRSRQIFTALAELLNETSEFTEPTTLPDQIGPAADVFLASLRDRPCPDRSVRGSG